MSLISMCKLLIFKRFPEEDKQYIYRKFGKIFFSIILPAEFHKKKLKHYDSGDFNILHYIYMYKYQI